MNKNYFEIKLEKAPPGYKKDGVLYQFGVFHMGDAKSFDEEMKQMIGPNIRVVKPEELIDDGEGIFIEEIEWLSWNRISQIQKWINSTNWQFFLVSL